MAAGSHGFLFFTLTIHPRSGRIPENLSSVLLMHLRISDLSPSRFFNLKTK